VSFMMVNCSAQQESQRLTTSSSITLACERRHRLNPQGGPPASFETHLYCREVSTGRYFDALGVDSH
jgi:hypothetical protein